MPIFFGFQDGELYAAKSGLETIVNVVIPLVIPLVIGAGTLYAVGRCIWNDAKQRNQQRQKLYQDMEQIPTEQRPAVMQLLQDLREGKSQWSVVSDRTYAR